jgi:hypothetical protein
MHAAGKAGPAQKSTTVAYVEHYTVARLVLLAGRRTFAAAVSLPEQAALAYWLSSQPYTIQSSAQ